MTSIGIDGQIFAIQQYGGISRYFSALLDRNILPSGELDIFPLFARHRNGYLSDLGIGAYQPNHDASKLLSGEMHLDANNQSSPYRPVKIVHTTFYVGQHPRANLSEGKRPLFVASLYDMIPENYPGFFSRGNPHYNKLDWLERSDCIVSISHSAAADLLDIRPGLADRIRVIHLGTNTSPVSRASREKRIAKWPFFLFIGIRKGYKNSIMLFRAFARVLPSLPDHRLVFAGGRSPNALEQQLIKDLNITEKVVFCRPSDEQLVQLYEHAEAVVVPSLAEGFSLPLIEALATDTPVICSEISVHKEVGKKFCYFVSPTNVEEWAAILADSSYLERPGSRLGAEAESLRNYYSVKRMAGDHHALYKSL